MSTIPVESQQFDFDDGWQVDKYDTSDHFKGRRRYEWKFPVRVKKNPLHWSEPLGQAAVDLLAWHAASRRFLFIEVKDYRRKLGQSSALVQELPAVVARKARDTLAGLAQASYEQGSDMRPYAIRLAQATSVEVLLDIQWPVPRRKAAPPNPQLQALVAQGLQTAFHRSGLTAKVIDSSNRTEWQVR